MSSNAFRIHSTGLGRTDIILASKVWTGTDSQSEIAGTGKSHYSAGGMALVSAGVASQFLKAAKVPVTYYGVSGDDANSSSLRHLLAQTPLDLTCFRQRQGISPSTRIINDTASSPDTDNWIYSHDPGTVAWDASVLGESFFQATLNVYAPTNTLGAWPTELPDLLSKGHRRGALNVVATGFDPAAATASLETRLNFDLGESCSHIDLIVADGGSVCQWTGKPNISESIDVLIRKGLPAVLVIDASGSIEYRSQGGVFGQCSGRVPNNPALFSLSLDKVNYPGDGLGVNDNFLAGLLADLMLQILADDFYPKGELHIERELLEICPVRLRHAIEFGVVAAGLARLQCGGLQIEANRGQRLAQVRKYFPDSAPVGRPW